MRKRPTVKAVIFGTTAVATLAAAASATAQDAIQVSASQFGYTNRAVAETNVKLDIFGGGDESGGTYGGAPSLTVPLGDKLGLQIDGVAGVTGDETGFAGGAAQLFYRDPQKFLIGVAGGGVYVDSVAQYGVAAIAEYYLDNVTLEGLVGYETGDVIDGVYGRAGLSVYANPNLRLGGGVSYSRSNDLGGDIQVEALLTDVPGMALFATGIFDQQGAMGLGGVRFYMNSGTNLLTTDRTKQQSAPTLIDMQRHMNRPNFLFAAGSGFGIRQISLTGDATSNPPPPPPPPEQCKDHSLKCKLHGLVDRLVAHEYREHSALTTLTGWVDDQVNARVDKENSALEARADRLHGLIDGLGNKYPILAPLTGPLDALINARVTHEYRENSALTALSGRIDERVNTRVDKENSALAALANRLHSLIDGLGNRKHRPLVALTGWIDDQVNARVDKENSALEARADRLHGLIDGLGNKYPILAPLTGPLDALINARVTHEYRENSALTALSGRIDERVNTR